jgi:ADP-ribose pyrophosphatase
MAGGYRTLSSRPIYSGERVKLREDLVEKPGGSRGEFAVADVMDGSTVLAINERGEACLVREFKYAIGRNSLELISGGIDPGESPAEAARRELEEEAGYRAAEWVDFGVLDPFTSMIASRNYLFLARGLEPVPTRRDEGEVLDVLWTPFKEAVAMAMRSEITHGASCALILKANEWLRAQGR